jgi:hypothetical protein
MNCERCGISVSLITIESRRTRGIEDSLCTDCRNGRYKQISYGDLVCKPWRGEVDEDLNPIDNHLRLYLPGERICGHGDCVNKEHIIPAPKAEDRSLEMERNDISYRTGRLSQLQDYMRELHG